MSAPNAAATRPKKLQYLVDNGLFPDCPVWRGKGLSGSATRLRAHTG